MLARLGHSVVTTRGRRRSKASDAEQWTAALLNGWIFLTHNRKDYEALAAEYFAAGQTHSGIIIAARRLPYDLAGRVLDILNSVTADEMENQLRYI